MEVDGRAELLDRLRSAEHRQAEPRPLRVARHPFRRLVPWMLEENGRTLVRRAETFFGGELLVPLPEPVGVSLYRYGFYDPLTTASLLRLVEPGDRVVDAGAHIGYFTSLASRLVGPAGEVVAFEPNEFTRALLRRNVGGSANVVVVGKALGAQPDAVELRVPRQMASPYSTVSSGDRLGSADGEHWLSQPVEQTSLDAYCSETGLVPTLIKLDVENGEEAALAGMEDVLARHRPTLIVELGDIGTEAGRSRRLVDRVLEKGYVAFELSADRELRPHTLQTEYGYVNLTFRPAESPS